jgi:hypothetical protein
MSSGLFFFIPDALQADETTLGGSSRITRRKGSLEVTFIHNEPCLSIEVPGRSGLKR